MPITRYSKKEFTRIMSDEEGEYFLKDIKPFWKGRKNILYIGIEGDNTKEEERTYKALERLVERIGEPTTRFYSGEGEETYSVYPIPESTLKIEKYPLLTPIKGKDFVFVEVGGIPGMVDFLFLY